MKEYQLQLDQIENNYNRQSLTYSSSTCATAVGALSGVSADPSTSADVSASAVSANNSDHSSANNVCSNKISDNNSNHSTVTTCRTSEYFSDLYVAH